MGRKKNYDRDVLIQKAVEIFRDHGFAGTSTQMLVEGLGVNRFSLYAEFGNKQLLFEAALERYNHKVVQRSFSPLEGADAGVEEIRTLLSFYASAGEGPAAGRGCLLCNTAVEFGPVDPTGAGLIHGYFEHISKAYLAALSNAHRKGELRSSVALNEEADFFTASTLGLFVLIRAKAAPKTIQNAAKIAMDHLEGDRKSVV